MSRQRTCPLRPLRAEVSQTAGSLSPSEVSAFAQGVESFQLDWIALQARVKGLAEDVKQDPPIFGDYTEQGVVRTLVATDDLSNGGLLSKIEKARELQVSVDGLLVDYAELRGQALSLSQSDKRMELIAHTYSAAVGFDAAWLAAWADHVVFGDGDPARALNLLVEASRVTEYAEAEMSEFLAEAGYSSDSVTASLY